MASECDQCLPSCPIAELTPECTNQCLVLACDDPDHGTQNCQVTDGATACDGSCISASACDDCPGLDEILLCCTDYHSYLADQKSYVTPWPASFACTQGYLPHAIQALISDSSISSSASSSPSLSPFLPQLHVPSAFALPPSHPFACMWANCHSAFNSLPDLAAHVNLHHLSTDAPALPLQPPDDPNLFTRSLSCHWGDCEMFPSHVPTSSSSEALDVLSMHLMQDHLGLNLDFPSLHPPQLPLVNHDTSHQLPVSSNPPSHDCSGTHVCKWKDCTETFSSCDDLTAHIASVHIGGGKAQYECFWEGCNRNGSNAFASKQKISRHLQSHTGHRPFQCQVCNQNFSEAATLQQHMRRHTREKPYVCDYPGCGKAFSITGALTIHKRTHNGQRPFQCKFCDKAFSESSNLSKHLRTHTGARPYVCTEEGCNKAFARPDQLARHTNVHRKKGPKG